MDLAELINMLIEEEGLTEREAASVAAASLKAKRSSASMARTRPNDFPVSAQQYNNGVDYGEETPQEAKERWMRQEMEDPNGIYGGGATAGGVFGDGVVISDQYDPTAVSRTMSMQAQLLGARTQVEMLRLMAEMRTELQSGRVLPQKQPRRELDDGRGPERRLGQKKRGGR